MSVSGFFRNTSDCVCMVELNFSGFGDVENCSRLFCSFVSAVMTAIHRVYSPHFR